MENQKNRERTGKPFSIAAEEGRVVQFLAKLTRQSRQGKNCSSWGTKQLEF